jgi:hypothetical protein
MHDTYRNVVLFQGTGAAFEAAGLRVGQVILQVDGVTTLGRSAVLPVRLFIMKLTESIILLFSQSV